MMPQTSQQRSTRSEIDIEELKALVESKGWSSFETAIQKWLEDEYASIVTLSKYEDFLCVKERIKALKQILEYPRTLIERQTA